MSNSAVRILVVGPISPGTLAALQRLERDGWSNHSVTTIAEAEGALKMFRFDIVLAAEDIADGRGYDLTNSVLELGATLFVSVALSEALLWLPVIQRGMLTLGERALNSSMLQLEVAGALSEPGGKRGLAWSREMLGLPTDAAVRELTSAKDRRTGPYERRGRPALSGLEMKRLLRVQRKAAAGLSSPEDEAARHEFEKTHGLRRDGVLGRHFR